MKCFAKEVEKLVSDYGIEKPLVFISSDNQVATDELLKLLRDAKISAFSDTFHNEPTHIDRTGNYMKGRMSEDERQARLWHEHVRSFVDWLLLTRMDYLLISRSGFGESAQQFSLAPTRRFAHQQGANKCMFYPYKLFGPLRMELNLENSNHVTAQKKKN